MNVSRLWLLVVRRLYDATAQATTSYCLFDLLIVFLLRAGWLVDKYNDLLLPKELLCAIFIIHTYWMPSSVVFSLFWRPQQQCIGYRSIIDR